MIAFFQYTLQTGQNRSPFEGKTRIPALLRETRSKQAIYPKTGQNLAYEILERIKSSPPKFFENLVVDLLIAMGYGGSRKDAGQAIGQVGDGGIDGIIKEDKLGLDAILKYPHCQDLPVEVFCILDIDIISILVSEQEK